MSKKKEMFDRLMNEAAGEVQKFWDDMVVFGVGVLEQKEDGSIVRLDPHSEEAKRAIFEKRKKK